MPSPTSQSVSVPKDLHSKVNEAFTFTFSHLISRRFYPKLFYLQLLHLKKGLNIVPCLLQDAAAGGRQGAAEQGATGEEEASCQVSTVKHRSHTSKQWHAHTDLISTALLSRGTYAQQAPCIIYCTLCILTLWLVHYLITFNALPEHSCCQGSWANYHHIQFVVLVHTSQLFLGMVIENHLQSMQQELKKKHVNFRRKD